MFPDTCINLDNLIYIKYIDAWKILNVPQNSISKMYYAIIKSRKLSN